MGDFFSQDDLVLTSVTGDESFSASVWGIGWGLPQMKATAPTQHQGGWH